MGCGALITELASSTDNPVRVVFETDRIVRPTREAANSVIKAGCGRTGRPFRVASEASVKTVFGNRLVSSAPDLPPPTQSLPSEEFVQLFSRNQRRIFLHILYQTGNPDDAEDILQETNVVIWAKFAKFEVGTNFIAWSFQIANYEVLRFREKKRTSRLRFSDELIDVIAYEAQQVQDDLDLRRAALQDCLKKLRSADRELIESRYQPGNKGNQVAEAMGRPSNSVYQSISRIRKTLFECVTRRLAAESSQ